MLNILNLFLTRITVFMIERSIDTTIHIMLFTKITIFFQLVIIIILGIDQYLVGLF